jgi:hypothetical protein
MPAARAIAAKSVWPAPRLAAGHFVMAVVKNQHMDIRGMIRQGDEIAQAHQGAAVAVKHNDAALRLRQCQSQTEARRVPHGRRDVREIERRIRQRRPKPG